jgi:hypothetical protein
MCFVVSASEHFTIMLNVAIQPKFSGLICDAQRRDPETGVRIFKYELTNDTSRYPLGRVVCPQSGQPGNDRLLVAFVSAILPTLAKLDKEDRLDIVRNLIRMDSQNWQIGKNKPTDFKDEALRDRGNRLLQQSTADLCKNPNGSLSMIMDYDLDQRGGNLTQLLERQQPPPPAYRPSALPNLQGPSPYFLPPPAYVTASFQNDLPNFTPLPPCCATMGKGAGYASQPLSYAAPTFQRLG